MNKKFLNEVLKIRRFRRFNEELNVVGTIIKRVRIENNISLGQLSKKLELIGIELLRHEIKYIEDGKRIVKDFEAYGIAYVLGIPLEELFSNMKKHIES